MEIHAVRDYTEKQLDAWAPDNVDKAQWRDTIAGINPYVLEHKRGIIAYGDLQEDGYIDHFFCDPDWQRRGVGSLPFFWTRALRWLKSNW